MLNSSGHRSNLVFVLFLFVAFGCSKQKPVATTIVSPEVVVSNVAVDTISTLSDRKLALTSEYCQRNYGFSGYRLDSPKMVVVHHTVIPTLRQTLALFQRDELAPNRKFINRFSPLNVGIHYVIDRDGTIYNLLPDTIIARHIIGFNHVSLGIENVAATKEDLTEAQLKSNAALVNALKSKHPTIQYLIGHDEYNNTDLPHYELFKSLDENYQPYDKPDPGEKFMTDLRYQLLENHKLEFLD